MSDSLEEKIATWLRRQGYPLELKAASLARQAGFEVSQSEYYLDPETKTPREIDLLLKRTRVSNSCILEFVMTVECKSSRDKPWLIFGSESDVPQYKAEPEAVLKSAPKILGSFVVTKYADQLFIKYSVNGDYQNLFPTIDKFSFVGHGLTQALSEAGDAPYKAVTSSAKAASSHVLRMNEFHEYMSVFSVVVPLIVIDVPLFQVSLEGPADDLVVRQVTSSAVRWKQPIGGRAHFAVYVVHVDSLAEFLGESCRAARWWLNQPENEILEAIAKVDNGAPKKTAA